MKNTFRYGAWISLVVTTMVVLIGGCSDEERTVDFRGAMDIHRLTSSSNVVQPVYSGEAGNLLFGYAVAVSNDVAAVGAMYDDTLYKNGGSVSLYSRDATSGKWGYLKQMFSDEKYNRLGRSLAFSGDTLIAGAIFGATDAVGAGSIYIYERNLDGENNWGQRMEVLSPGPATVADGFGCSVAIDGDTVVVGAASSGVLGEGAGLAYIFERNLGGTDNWGLGTTLQSPAPVVHGGFGESVAIQGNVVVVGEIGGRRDTVESGLVHMFERHEGGENNWGVVRTISTMDTNAGDDFGASVDLQGNLLAVGAPWNDVVKANAGSVFVFQKDLGGDDNWGQLKWIRPKLSVYPMGFGNSVDLDAGVTLLIGAMRTFVTSSSTTYYGRAFVHEKNEGGANNFGEVMELYRPGASASEFFGWDVAIDGNDLLVGVPQAGLGEAHFFAYTPPGTRADGESCSIDTVCLSGYCRDGVCCNSDCGGGLTNDCMACNFSDGSGDAGVCAPIDAGTACGAQTEGECDNRNTCDDAGVCLENHIADNTACTADRNDCTQDVCLSGVCRHEALPAGTSCGSDISHSCTAPDSCDGSGNCLSNDAADNTACDNGDFCTVNDSCREGECMNGSPRNCDDAVACTLDVCDADASECTHSVDDGLCTGGGECRLPACDTHVGCRYTNLPDWTTCTDGACFNGVCEVTAEGDQCDDARQLALNVVTAGSIRHIHPTREIPVGCVSLHSVGADLFFKVSLEADNRYRFAVTSIGDANMALAVLDGCGGGALCLGGADEVGSGGTEVFSGFVAPATGIYYVYVTGLTSSTAAYHQEFEIVVMDDVVVEDTASETATDSEAGITADSGSDSVPEMETESATDMGTDATEDTEPEVAKDTGQATDAGGDSADTAEVDTGTATTSVDTATIPLVDIHCLDSETNTIPETVNDSAIQPDTASEVETAKVVDTAAQNDTDSAVTAPAADKVVKVGASSCGCSIIGAEGADTIASVQFQASGLLRLLLDVL